MLPQTYDEVFSQHYVDLPIELFSELQPKDEFGIYSSDLDDVWEKEKSRRYIDLFFTGLGESNHDFKSLLPSIQQDIVGMYQNREIEEHMRRIEDRFRISGITRGNVEDAGICALDNYEIDSSIGEFVSEDLHFVGLGFRWNTGNFEYPMRLLTARVGLPMKILPESNYTKIQYSKPGRDGVVAKIYPNVLWKKQEYNMMIAKKRALSQQMIITMADSPKLEPYFPIFAGMAIWVDADARRVPVESRVNLYIPKARDNKRMITPKLVNWYIGTIDRTLDSEKIVERRIRAIEEIRLNFEQMKEHPDSVMVFEKAFSRIVDESRHLVTQIKRHRPTLAKELEMQIYHISRQSRIENMMRHANRLLEIIKETIPEYYATEDLRKHIERLKKERGK